ncbi:hypothetical protein EDD18DRAFT_1097843 [Armillaria luteobubalina]|uniref:Uncharacterized protein n=1 Tax=Armillaria luteobubalina TaxID=153913 RepID=A0AA39V5J7_9AGAR|nr:hypothetical protein EDD18DRAFT_1097843 [Armillaria luteobubalina]
MDDKSVALSFGGEDINEMVQRIHIHQVSECGYGQFRGGLFLVAPGREEIESNIHVDVKYLLPTPHQVLRRAEDEEDIGDCRRQVRHMKKAWFGILFISGNGPGLLKQGNMDIASWPDLESADNFVRKVQKAL